MLGWFTEGFDSPDFIEAKVLLEETTRASNSAESQMSLGRR
jgi:hypothetical protein